MTSPPTVQAVGAANHGTTGSVTYTLPAHQAGDILLLFVECGQTTGVPTPPAGWAHVANSPRAQGSNVEAVSLMWLRAASSSETNPVVPAQANHQAGFTANLRGVISSGTPYDTGGQGVNRNLSTAFSVTGSSTTTANTLVVCAASSAADDTADQFSTFTNASLTSVTNQGFAGTTDGNGGSVDMVTGIRVTVGASGTFASTQLTSTQWCGIMVAFLPDTGVTNVNLDQSIALTDTITSAAQIGVSGDVAIPLTDTISSAAQVGVAGAAAIGLAVAAASALSVGVSSGVSITETVAITSSLSIGGSAVSIASTVPLTDTITSAAQVGVSSGVTVPLTASVASGAQVGVSSGVSVSEAISVASTAVVGVASGATVPEVVTITSAARIGKVTGAAIAPVVTITSVISVQSAGPATPYVELTAPARLGTLIAPARSALVVPPVSRTLTAPEV